MQLVFVRRRASCVVRRALQILHFLLLLKNYKANYYNFWYEAPLGKKNLNCQIFGSTTLGVPGVGPNMPK